MRANNPFLIGWFFQYDTIVTGLLRFKKYDFCHFKYFLRKMVI